MKKVTFNRKTVEVFTDGGSIQANRVVVATGMPTPLFKSLARHFWFRTTYLAQTAPVPAKIRQALGRRESVAARLRRSAAHRSAGSARIVCW